MRIPESELIINGDGSVFHIHLKPEELADNVILVGDPGRVDMIAEMLEDIEFRHASRAASSSPSPAGGTASASPSFPMASAPTTSTS